VDAYVAAKAHKVQRAVICFYVFDDGLLVDDSACADILVSDFTVSHCLVGQTDVLAAGVDKAVGIFGAEHIIGGGGCNLRGVVVILVRVWIVSPAVADYQYEASSVEFELFSWHKSPVLVVLAIEIGYRSAMVFKGAVKVKAASKNSFWLRTAAIRLAQANIARSHCKSNF